MLTLYSDATPNGFRATVILAECGLDYRLVRVNTEQGDQRSDWFLKINPAGAIPVLVDANGEDGAALILPQSGAIVLYAAERSGLFVPASPARRAIAYRWFYQIGTDITSASSWLFNHAKSMPVKDDRNVAWLQQRLAAALDVAEQWLSGHEYFADEVSIADFLLYPNFWFRRAQLESSGRYPNLCRWGSAMASRRGVTSGMSAFS